MIVKTDYLQYVDQPELKEVKAVVIHYTANALSTAKQNIDYLRKKGLGYHYIIDLDGTIYQLQTLKKRCRHCGSRKYTATASRFFGEYHAPKFYHTAEKQHSSSPNNVTIGVCFCHADETGKPSDAQYEALTDLLATLCMKYHLPYNGGIWRHYDVTEKNCPLYYVEHEVDEFVKLLHDVANKMVEDIER